MKHDSPHFLEFVRYCNEYASNGNEYSIAESLIYHISDVSDITINDIAEEANTSVASVSRFIKKIGFSSLNELKIKLPQEKNQYRYQMDMFFMKNNKDLNEEMLKNDLLDSAMANLKSTINNLDNYKINRLIDMIFEADGISFLGDSREVRAFFTLQLNLMTMNRPTFAFVNKMIGIHHLSMQKEGHLAIYFVLAKEWVSSEWKKAINAAHDKGVKIVIFSQDELNSDISSDLFISYGIPGSNNNGYYSLSILCSLIYMFIMSRNEGLRI